VNFDNNICTSNKKQQKECVLWNKGVQPIISKKLVFCELQKCMDIKQEATKQNVYCGARDFTIGKSYVS